MHASNGVAELWIVDLRNNCLLSYASPVDGQYQSQTTTARLGVTPLSAPPEVSIDLSKLLDP